ncbi:hypothetical protein H0H87_001841, partial [Tephrocybe sp. NHM501043]
LDARRTVRGTTDIGSMGLDVGTTKESDRTLSIGFKKRKGIETEDHVLESFASETTKLS